MPILSTGRAMQAAVAGRRMVGVGIFAGAAVAAAAWAAADWAEPRSSGSATAALVRRVVARRFIKLPVPAFRRGSFLLGAR